MVPSDVAQSCRESRSIRSARERTKVHPKAREDLPLVLPVSFCQVEMETGHSRWFNLEISVRHNELLQNSDGCAFDEGKFQKNQHPGDDSL